MADYAFTVDKPHRVPELLVTDALIAEDDDTINATLPEGLPSGTKIHSAGYGTIKEKSLTGTWVAITEPEAEE